MKILIVGNGGREHALLWKLRRDAPEARFFVTRPNGGMSGAEAVDLAPTDVDGVARWAEAEAIDLTVIGPEAPLAGGLADRLEDAGLPVFGPRAGAARIESSKAFAKALMVEAGVPTAGHRSFDRLDRAEAWVRECGAPIVVKASGLAAGKGAIVCETVDEAVDALGGMMARGELGEAGEEVVVEEFMRGEELSFFCLVSGEDVLPLLPSQDHKPIGEGDTGPNTGGMGAYAPVSVASPALVHQALDTIMRPTARALATAGTPFHGLLYGGLMLTSEGPRVVEFNCRFGDPETQVVLPLLESSLLDLLLAVAERNPLAGTALRWKPGAAVTTVVASGGYPGSYRKGLPISIPPQLGEDPDVLVFHAGTRTEDGSLVTAGGRVLAVTAVAPDVARAADRSREAAESIRFEGAYLRRDIGWRERDRA